MEKQKIKLITHNDLDGVGCYIVAKYLFGDTCDIDVSFCTHHSLKEVLDETILCMNEFNRIYITDIAPTEEYFDLFFSKAFIDKTELFDHHKTSEFLTDYDFSHVHVEKNRVLQSGTTLFYEYLKGLEGINKPTHYLEKFVELIRLWDTWDWYKTNNLEAKALNDLLYLKGIKWFYKDMLVLLDEDEGLFSAVDEIMLTYEADKKKRYIKAKSKEIIEYDLDDYHIGVIFAEQYVSELGNNVCEQHPEFDFVVVVSGKTCSFRTVKENIDVSEIAKHYGGGGHPKASGCPISKGKQLEYITSILRD